MTEDVGSVAVCDAPNAMAGAAFPKANVGLFDDAASSSLPAVTGTVEYSEQRHRPSRTDLEKKLGLHSTNFHVGTLGFNGIRVLIHAPGGDGEVRDGSKHIENIDLTAADQG